MDPITDLHIPESSETQSTEESSPQQQLAIVPFASLSLSLSKILPINFFTTQPKTSLLFSSAPNKVKVPTQAASLAHLSLATTSSLSPPNFSFKSTISANPLHAPLSLNPLRPSDPSNAAGIRRASIVWFRNDLRVHDNECLNNANDESMSVLPVYCFDPREYGKSSSGLDKTGSYRATFLIESISDLRKNLQARGSDLIVRVGKPETVLVELAQAVGADAVYAHRDVSREQVNTELKIETAMKDEGVEVKYFWGSTLYHLDDLPFKLEDMPSHYGGFRKKGLPSRGDVEPGEIPSSPDLGLNPTQDRKTTADTSMVGGETEALRRLKKFAVECQAQPVKGINGTHDSICGANFSCKISPWLTMGELLTGMLQNFLSFCFLFLSLLQVMYSMHLNNSIRGTISAASNLNGGGSNSPDPGMNWLMFELLWRDFFRFITRKCSSPKKQLEQSPATSCTPAFA
ncbi:hypothetical protein K2173_026276 [Erythroxylum novogranatense]|uniref:Photolyase/cryptochrome alpha/beta domain-containing protein n=1 Tax=Erythroxylum novogranatense TaxID=1862640 RepID=A0AAV8SBV7_9ROSI|nr:hypothetical protein K2173_026276 [Erythroxylum novogranatense]